MQISNGKPGRSFTRVTGKIAVEAVASHWGGGCIAWPAVIVVNGIRFTSPEPVSDKEEQRINKAVLAISD